jgi:SAM-dependent methyltransferase
MGVHTENLWLLGVAVFGGMVAFCLWYSLKKGAPWWPTPARRTRALLRAVSLKPGEVVVDAGCGDGRVLLIAAKEFGARGLGIEIHPLFAWIARLRTQLAGLSSCVTIRRADLFSVDLRSADVLFLFLLQETNVALQEKLRRELRPGTRVVSYAFTLPQWHEQPSGDPYHHVYVIDEGGSFPDPAAVV